VALQTLRGYTPPPTSPLCSSCMIPFALESFKN
jgi:hypothetical protein